MLSKAIADALEKADPDHKDIYQENASAYSEKLKDLDAKTRKLLMARHRKHCCLAIVFHSVIW